MTSADVRAIDWLPASPEPAIRRLARGDLLGQASSDDHGRVLEGPIVRASLDGQQADGGLGSYRAVGPELIREAAKEAVKIDDLLVCGFAFDPLAGEETSTLGRLTILQAWMKPDLAMGDELLKKTGSPNLFMVLREPDIEISDEAWSTINSTVSCSFPQPKSGKIALKVLNHYSDEVMKVPAA